MPFDLRYFRCPPFSIFFSLIDVIAIARHFRYYSSSIIFAAFHSLKPPPPMPPQPFSDIFAAIFFPPAIIFSADVFADFLHIRLR
jgi:hypothetical protein